MKIRIRDRRVYWAVMALGLILAMALGHHVVYGEHGYLTWRGEQRQYLELKKKTDKLKNENGVLQKEIDSLNRHDPDVIEGKARDQHLARPGEKIYTYTPRNSQKNLGAPKPANTPETSGDQP
jgi:cell division protein FtsB